MPAENICCAKISNLMLVNNHDIKFLGSSLSISNKKMSSKDCRIYVGNLPQFVKKHELQDFFDRYGQIHMIDIHNRFDPAFAFIEFDDPRYIKKQKLIFLLSISKSEFQ